MARTFVAITRSHVDSFASAQRLPGVDAGVVDEDVEAALRGSYFGDGGHAGVSIGKIKGTRSNVEPGGSKRRG